MDLPDLELPDAFAAGPDPSEETISSAEAMRPGDTAGMAWLGEIVAQLEEDPDECWPAIEALAAVNGEVRVQIIAALAEYRERPGVRSLLDLLGSVRDPALRTAARHAVADDQATTLDVAPSGPDRADLAVFPAAAAGRIVRSLVTAVDGEGSGTVVVSVRDGVHRRTAAFRCDVRQGSSTWSAKSKGNTRWPAAWSMNGSSRPRATARSTCRSWRCGSCGEASC